MPGITAEQYAYLRALSRAVGTPIPDAVARRLSRDGARTRIAALRAAYRAGRRR